MAPQKFRSSNMCVVPVNVAICSESLLMSANPLLSPEGGGIGLALLYDTENRLTRARHETDLLGHRSAYATSALHQGPKDTIQRLSLFFLTTPIQKWI